MSDRPAMSSKPFLPRIGLTVGDNDPDRASEIAHDLADIVIDEVRAHRLELTKKVSADIAAYRESLDSQMASLERERRSQELRHVTRPRATL